MTDRAIPEGSADPQRLALRIGDRLMELQPGAEITVGSGKGCALRIAHGQVAPHHATLHVERGELLVVDHGSEYGTTVRELRIEKARVSIGETIAFGPITVLVVHANTVTPSRGHILWLPPASGRSLRDREDPTFAEAVGGAVRRSPWFALSMILHVILALILAVLLQVTPGGTERSIRVQVIEEPDEGLDEIEPIERPQEVVIVEETAIENASIPDPLIRDLSAGQDSNQVELLAPEPELTNVGYLAKSPDLYTRLGGKGAGVDILRSGHPGIGGKDFRRTVSRIRATGLEIVFVFDSTGSMDAVLQATKRRIALMAETLHALVPDSRIGIVTYRDHDPGEDYVTRQVPLGSDYFRAVNFMQVIEADGGGDRPEAVYDGLVAAIEQKWSKKAKRVIVLIGDAPPHPSTERRIRSRVRGFARAKNTHVHTILTTPSRIEGISADVREAFDWIAKTGKGESVAFEDEETILQQVLGLAFGREFRKNLDAVAELVAGQIDRLPARARRAVETANATLLDSLMKERPIHTGFVRALARSRNPKVATYLIGVLRDPDHGTRARQAASYALQRILELQQPPVDPIVGARITNRDEAALRMRANPGR